MPKERKKTGPKPKPPEEVKRVIKAVRMNDSQIAELTKTSKELKLAESDLIRVGTLLLLKDIESGDIDLGDLYRYAATT